MNKIDQDWKNFAEHGILAEGLSPNLFHFTTLRKLINILETNKFLTSVAVGTTSDETDRGKFYFFSMARSKGSSYGKSYSYNEGVTINLDGYKLGHNYKGMPFNYWGNIEQSGQSEAEDRVITDKPFIENASKYITEVHLLLGVSYSKNKWDKVDSLKLEILKNAVDELEKKGIPYWIYHVGKYFTLQSKGNYAVRSFDAFVDIVKRIQGDIEQIEPSSYIPAEKEYENLKAIYEYVDALLRNDLSNMSDYAKKLHEKFKYHGYGMHLNDRIAVLQSDIHNTKSDFGARNHLEKIRQAMRRVGAKTIKELVLWIKEKTDKIAKEEEIKKQEFKGYLQLLVDVMDTVWSARDIKQRPSNEVSLTKKIVKGDISATVLEISKHIEEANNAPQGSAQAEELFQLKNRIKYHKDNDRMSGTITSIVQWIKNSIESYRPEEVAFLYEARDNKRVISFDFDNSLSLSKYDEEYGMIDDGPNMEMVNKLKQHKANGDTVYIVTARTKEHEKLYSSGLEKGDAGYTQTVKEFVVDNDLPVDGTYFTNGRLKAKTLLELGVDLHYDDNDDEVQACKDAGIEVIQVVADKMINESLTSLLCEKSIRDVGKEDVIDKNYVKELLRSDDIDRVLVGFFKQRGMDLYEFDINDVEENEEMNGEFIKWLGKYLENKYYEVRYDLENTIDNDGKITIYREMTVKENWMEHLAQQGKHLGIYWTWDKDKAQAHWGGFSADDSIALLVAKIDEEYVNWEDTIRLNMDVSLGDMEREIRLFKGTTIELEAVIVDDEEQDISALKNRKLMA